MRDASLGERAEKEYSAFKIPPRTLPHRFSGVCALAHLSGSFYVLGVNRGLKKSQRSLGVIKSDAVTIANLIPIFVFQAQRA